MSAALKKQVFDFKTQYGLALDDTDDAIVADYFAAEVAPVRVWKWAWAAR